MFSLFKHFLILGFLFSFWGFAELEQDRPEIKAFIAENYDSIYDSHFSENLIAVTKDGKMSLLDKQNFKEVIPPKYESLIYHSEDFISYEEGGLHGLLNSKGEEVASPHFDSIDSYDEDSGLISFKKYGKTGFIDQKGFITELYEDTSNEGKGRVWLKQGGLWGLFDKKGFTKLVPFQYDSIRYTHNEDFLAVSRGGLMTLFDRQKLQEVFPPRYEKIYNSNQERYPSSDCNGCYLSELILESPQLFFVRSSDGLVGLIDSKGREIVRSQHEYRNIRHAIYSIQSEKLNLRFIKIKSDDLYGLIDAEGNEFIPAIYEEIEWSFARGDLSHLFSVKREGLWTLLDILNKTELTAPKYEEISEYKEVKPELGVKKGIAIAKKEGLWVLLDTTEGREISQQHEDIEIIRHDERDIITAKKEDLWVLLDTEGQEISQKYEDIEIIRHDRDMLTAKRDGLWTFLDTQNQEIMPPKYEELYVSYFRPANSYKIYAKREGRWTFLDNRGQEIMPPTYESLLGLVYEYNNDFFGKASP